MQFDTIEKLLVRCLELATSGDAGRYIENPTKRFAKDLQRGKFDFMPDDEYDSLADAAERLAELWNGMPRRKAGDLLLDILEQVTIPDDRLERIASQLMKWYGRYGTYRPLPEDFAPDFGDGGETKENPFAAVLNTPMAPRTPAGIRDAITARVIGQPRAAKAAAMIMYHHLAGRRSNSVFAGPTGCGKSEIWRALGSEYPGRVRIVDFSRMSGDGWVGSVHLRDVFDGIDRSSLARDGLIVVLDEADKILCETAMSSGGNNHNRIIQNNLLKILDGDIIEFGTENGKQEAFSVDCSNVSVVMLGAFENLMEKKAASRAKPIGFGESPEAEAGPPRHADISYDDLINAGTRREIAGRVNTIIALDPLDAGKYKAILEGPVISGLQESLGCAIAMDDAAAVMLSEKAEASGLGVRWMKSAVFNAVSDAMFNAPSAEGYFVGMRDGELYCQAEEPDFADSDLDEPVPA